MAGPLRVEVYPEEPDRWIAVIAAPRGDFLTETPTAAGVPAEVRESIAAVLEVADPIFELVDETGAPWSPAVAAEQLHRMGVGYRPGRRSWWGRVTSRRVPYRGDCPVCGHDWREHVPAGGSCGECGYEIEHGEPGAPSRACRVLPRPPERPAGPACRIGGASTVPGRSPSVTGGLYEFWTDRDEPVRLHDADLVSVSWEPGPEPVIRMRFVYDPAWVPDGLAGRAGIEFVFGGAEVLDWATPDPPAQAPPGPGGEATVSFFDWDGHRTFGLLVGDTSVTLTALTLDVRIGP